MMEQLQSTVDNMQTQLSTVQAAIDGNTHSSLFKQPPLMASQPRILTSG